MSAIASDSIGKSSDASGRSELLPDLVEGFFEKALEGICAGRRGRSAEKIYCREDTATSIN